MMKVPVAIINWNAINHTIECIDSVLKSKDIRFKIYVWDNNSMNNEFQRLVTHYKTNNEIEFFKSEENIGYTLASNELFKIILPNPDYKFIALLNNDTVVDELWLSHITNFSEKTKAGIVSSKMVYYYQRNMLDNVGHKILSTGEIIPIGSGKSTILEMSKNNIGACAGAALYDIAMLKKIGIFDTFFETGYEDAELGLRAFLSDYDCLYCSNAIVYHKMGTSIRKVFNSDYTIKIHTSILYTYFKLLPTIYLVLNFPFMLLKIIAMVVIDLLFWRPKYLYVLVCAWTNVWKNRSRIRHERNIFRNRNSKVDCLSLLNSIEFFLWFDIKRFWRIIILKQKSAIDSY